jgi:hypothetical protein
MSAAQTCTFIRTSPQTHPVYASYHHVQLSAACTKGCLGEPQHVSGKVMHGQTKAINLCRNWRLIALAGVLQ